MQIELSGQDVGIFVLGRMILKSHPKAHLIFHFCENQKGLCGESLWEPLLHHILSDVTRFGRIGIMYDHEDLTDEALASENIATKDYRPRDQKRALNVPEFSYFPTQILKHMALQGWGDSVEFRRIARQYLKKAKNHNIDTLFFPDSIFGEASTQKTLQQLAKNQLKIVTIADLPIGKLSLDSIVEEGSRVIEIDQAFSPFEIKRAAQILKTKLPKDLKRV